MRVFVARLEHRNGIPFDLVAQGAEIRWFVIKASLVEIPDLAFIKRNALSFVSLSELCDPPRNFLGIFQLRSTSVVCHLPGHDSMALWCWYRGAAVGSTSKPTSKFLDDKDDFYNTLFLLINFLAF